MLLDLDGTLTDPRAGITACIRHALLGLGQVAPAAPDLESFIGPPLRDGFRELLDEPSEDRIDAAIELFRERFATVGLYENHLYPGIAECLESLARSGLVLHVATSKPTVFARRIVEHFGIAHHFRSVVGSLLDGRRSDKAEIVAHILAREALAAASAVMVGDRRHDVEGARANAVLAVAVTWGFGDRRELETAAPALLVGSPGELAEQLLG